MASRSQSGKRNRVNLMIKEVISYRKTIQIPYRTLN